MMCQQYYESFKNNADVLEYARGTLGKEPGLVNVMLEAAGVKWDEVTGMQLATAKAATKKHVCAIRLLTGNDCTHYGKLLEDLENDFTQGQDNYPAMIQQAYSLLVHWK